MHVTSGPARMRTSHTLFVGPETEEGREAVLLGLPVTVIGIVVRALAAAIAGRTTNAAIAAIAATVFSLKTKGLMRLFYPIARMHARPRGGLP